MRVVLRNVCKDIKGARVLDVSCKIKLHKEVNTLDM